MPNTAPSQSMLSRLMESQPYMGLLNKIFMTQQTDPRVGESLQRLAPEMPEAQTGIVTPMSRWEKLIRGGAEAVTNPTGTGYNPRMLSDLGGRELDRTIAHELIHQRQFRDNPNAAMQNTLFNITHTPRDAAFSNPSEIEAYQYEQEREHKGKKYLRPAKR